MGTGRVLTLTEHCALQAEPRLAEHHHHQPPASGTAEHPDLTSTQGCPALWAPAPLFFLLLKLIKPFRASGLHSCCPLHQECAPHPTAGSPSSFNPQLKWHCLQKALPDHLSILSHMPYSFPAQSSHHCPQLSTHLHCLCVFAYFFIVSY